MADRHLATRKRRPGMPAVPFDAELLAEKIWELAGISPEERAKALKLAYRSAIDDLKAEKTHIVSHQGVVTSQIQMRDNAAIAKAREQIFALSGLEKAGGKQGGDLVIPLPPWAQVKIEKAADPSPAGPATEPAISVTIEKEKPS